MVDFPTSKSLHENLEEIIFSAEVGTKLNSEPKLAKQLGVRHAAEVGAKGYLRFEHDSLENGVSNGQVSEGDFIVWGATKDNPHGHIAMYLGTSSDGKIWVLEQNWNWEGKIGVRPIEPDDNTFFIKNEVLTE